MRVTNNKNGTSSKARQDLEQPDLVEGVSVHGRGLEHDYLGSLLTQAIPRFHDMKAKVPRVSNMD